MEVKQETKRKQEAKQSTRRKKKKKEYKDPTNFDEILKYNKLIHIEKDMFYVYRNKIYQVREKAPDIEVKREWMEREIFQQHRQGTTL